MTTQLVCLAVYILFAVFVYFSYKDAKASVSNKDVFMFAAFALLLRVIVSAATDGYTTDMNCFRGWSEGITRVLPWKYYDSLWCDYPPGYMYVLAILGAVKRILGNIPQWGYNLILKLPACLCDIVGGIFIFKIMQKHFGRKNTTAAAMVLYLFCPATIMNSAVWGQVDAVFALVLLASLYMLCEGKYYKSAAFLGIAVSLKIQALMFAPVFLFAFIEKVMSDRKLRRTFAGCIGVFIAVPVAISLPFIILKPPYFLFELYVSTMGQYPYASLNAFNLFSMLGANQLESGASFIFMNYKIWGTIFILLSVLVSAVLFIKGRGAGKEYYTAALLIALIYTFSSDMHERYLFPVMLLLAAAYACGKDRNTLYLAGAFSLSQYINVGYLYNMSIRGTYHIPPNDIVLRIGSLFTVLITLLTVYNYVKLYIPQKEKKHC